MAIQRQHLPAVLALALAQVFSLGPIAARADSAWDDIVPDFGESIPSPRAEEIAPPYRDVDEVPMAPHRHRPEPGVAVAPADRAEGASGPVAAHGAVDTAKPGIPATEASADGATATEGEPKSDERLGPGAAESDAPGSGDAATEMVRVPAPIVKAARRVLPGVVFKSVDLSRSGPSTVYGLSGESWSGRAVSVAIDQSGKVMKVDRQARDVEIPAEVRTLAEAVLPGARIERAMFSLRPGFVAFYTFTGEMGTGKMGTGEIGAGKIGAGETGSRQPFVLEIRSDGRSLAFVDPE